MVDSRRLTRLLLGVVVLVTLSYVMVTERTHRIEADLRLEMATRSLDAIVTKIHDSESNLQKTEQATTDLQNVVDGLKKKMDEKREVVEKLKQFNAGLRSESDSNRLLIEEKKAAVDAQIQEALQEQRNFEEKLDAIRHTAQRQWQQNDKLEKEIRELRLQLDLPPIEGNAQTDTANAVIIYVVNSNADALNRLRVSLQLLELNMLRCYPYPVVLFVEKDLPNEVAFELVELVPSAPSVSIEHICFDTCTPQGYPDIKGVWKWLDVVGMGWPGYAAMCRFYSGTIYVYPTLAQYDYYFRLDSDSYLLEQLPEDPIQRMIQDDCLYAYNNVQKDPANVVQQLYQTVLDFVGTHTEPAQPKDQPPPADFTSEVWPDPTLPEADVEHIKQLFSPSLIDGADLWDVTFPAANVTRLHENLGKTARDYKHTVYWTNFEIASFAPFRSAGWQAVFRALDSARGFYRFRWGDAPVHAIAIPLLIPPQQTCYIPNNRVPYMHRGDFGRHLATKLADFQSRPESYECKPSIAEDLPTLGQTNSYYQN